MSQKILQIILKSTVPVQDIAHAWLLVAPQLAEFPGLRWKIWIINASESEVGGVYLFDDEVSVQTFLNAPAVTSMKNDPTFSAVSFKTFDIMEEHTAITRGPVKTSEQV